MKRTLLAGSRCAYLFMTGGGEGSDKHDSAVKEDELAVRPLQMPVDEPFYVTFEGTEGSPMFFETTS